MKNKIVKFLGVLLTLTVLVSLFGVVTPVSAGDNSWSEFKTPTTNAAGTNTPWVMDSSLLGVGKMVYNSDKSAIFAIAATSGGATVLQVHRRRAQLDQPAPSVRWYYRQSRMAGHNHAVH